MVSCSKKKAERETSSEVEADNDSDKSSDDVALNDSNQVPIRSQLLHCLLPRPSEDFF